MQQAITVFDPQKVNQKIPDSFLNGRLAQKFLNGRPAFHL